MCNAELQDNAFNFEEWLDSVGLRNVKDKIKEDILKETDLQVILDTSSKITRKNAIKLAHHIGIYQGKQHLVEKKASSREKIIEDRLIIQEQDLRFEITILQEKLKESENNLKALRSEIVVKNIPKINCVETVEQELTQEQRRKIVAESWSNKIKSRYLNTI
jgi:6-pyruvoyl-tetrahydropterin synthase